MKLAALLFLFSVIISAQVQNDFSRFKAYAGDYKSQ